MAGTLLVSFNIRLVQTFSRVLYKKDIKGQWGHVLTLVLNIFSWLRKHNCVKLNTD